MRSCSWGGMSPRCLSEKGISAILGTVPNTGRWQCSSNGPAHNRRMALSRHPVEDHAPDSHLRVEALAAQDHGGHRPGHLVAVDHEDHGRLEELGQFGRAVLPFEVGAVVKTPVSFDQRNGVLRVRAAKRSARPDRVPSGRYPDCGMSAPPPGTSQAASI